MERKTFEGKPCVKCGKTTRYTSKKFRCVTCMSISNRIYKENNVEKIKLQKKTYCDKNKEEIKSQKKIYYNENKDKIDAQRKIYLKKNQEKIKLREKIYRENNKDKIKIRKKKWSINNRGLVNYSNKKRQCAKIKRTPKWANLEKIKEVYLNCPKGYHVDHIIPLQGKNVCGLHVENNLQYLTKEENLRKKNKFEFVKIQKKNVFNWLRK